MTTTREQDPHMERDPLLGTVVAGYRIESLIGQGGMGVVYRATELHTDERAAIKVMVPEIARNPGFRERFTREAESGIDHPNIVPIYKSGEEAGLLYIAMRLVEGEDLKSVIEHEGRILPARLVSIFTQAASALDAAHENGVVHRDVKPQNILIEAGSEDDFELVYLSDFGLVKRVSSQSSFTTSTYLMGSVQYMAPEQIEGKRVDGRSDVYSLGCVVYEALTGSVPFPKETEVAVLWAHMNEEPAPVSTRVPVLGTSVDQVIAKAMAKSPDDRYLTAGEMTSAVALELGISTRRARSPWAAGIASTGGRRRLLLRRKSQSVADRLFPKPVSRFKAALVGGLATLLALGGASLVELRDSKPDEPSSLDVIAALESPNAPGSKEVLKAAADKLPGIGRRKRQADARLGARDGRGLLGPGGVGRPGELKNVGEPASSKGPVARDKQSQPSDKGGAPQLGAAGDQKIAFVSTRGGASATRNYAIYTANADGTGLTGPLTTPSMWAFDPDLSPDGSKLLFTAIGRDSRRHVWIANSDGSNPRQVTHKPLDVFEREPEWSPDGKRIAFVRMVGDHNADLYLLTKVPSGGWEETRITRTPGEEWGPEFSPNGRRILYDYTPDQDNVNDSETSPSDIFIINADGSKRFNVTKTDQIYEGAGSWSPDGKWISHDGSGGVWITRADGNVRKKIATGFTYFTDWSPDGSLVTFQACGQAGQAEECQIRVVRVAEPFADWVASDALAAYDGMPEWGPLPR